jgi:hypothetical protein
VRGFSGNHCYLNTEGPEEIVRKHDFVTHSHNWTSGKLQKQRRKTST